MIIEQSWIENFMYLIQNTSVGLRFSLAIRASVMELLKKLLGSHNEYFQLKNRIGEANPKRCLKAVSSFFSSNWLQINNNITEMDLTQISYQINLLFEEIA